MTIKNRIELINLFNECSLNNLAVEVGSYKGAYAKEILKIYNGKLFLIDIWNKVTDGSYKDILNVDDYKNTYSECIDNISGHENRCFMLRSDSENAVTLFDDNSLDFVYIDANHRYEFVKKDIQLWYNKVRKGGIVAGHDYLMLDWYNDKSYAANGKDKHIYGSCGYMGEYGVNPAVDEFCKENNYKLTSTTEEWFGSWFFIK